MSAVVWHVLGCGVCLRWVVLVGCCGFECAVWYCLLITRVCLIVLICALLLFCFTCGVDLVLASLFIDLMVVLYWLFGFCLPGFVY